MENTMMRPQAQELLRQCARARCLLMEAENRLGRARNWGVYDLLSGGLIATYFKHRGIDDAVDCLNRARPVLRTLNRELARFRVNANISLEIDSFAKFADFVFDDIFSGIHVQRRINGAREQVHRVLAQLDAVERRLREIA